MRFKLRYNGLAIICVVFMFGKAQDVEGDYDEGVDEAYTATDVAGDYNDEAYVGDYDDEADVGDYDDESYDDESYDYDDESYDYDDEDDPELDLLIQLEELAKFAKVYYRCLDHDTPCNDFVVPCEAAGEERKECFLAFCDSNENTDSVSCEKMVEKEAKKETQKSDKKTKKKEKKKEKNAERREKKKERKEKRKKKKEKSEKKKENVGDKESSCEDKCDAKDTKKESKKHTCVKICHCRQRAALSNNPDKKTLCRGTIKAKDADDPALVAKIDAACADITDDDEKQLCRKTNRREFCAEKANKHKNGCKK